MLDCQIIKFGMFKVRWATQSAQDFFFVGWNLNLICTTLHRWGSLNPGGRDSDRLGLLLRIYHCFFVRGLALDHQDQI